MVYDDGVTTRLGENHYIMTTTTGGAANVMGKLEDYLQTEWPELDVYLTSVTDHFATVSVCGPNSKKIVSEIIPDLDFSDESFPHMSFKNTKIGKINCRVMRISFTGEQSYPGEANITANTQAPSGLTRIVRCHHACWRVRVCGGSAARTVCVRPCVRCWSRIMTRMCY